MRQSTVLINAALIIVKMVFTLMNERAQARQSSGQKSLADSASGILLDDGRTKPRQGMFRQGMFRQGMHSREKQRREKQRREKQSAEIHAKSHDDKTVSIAGDYAYVNTGQSLVIYNVSDKGKPTKVSETLF